MPTITVFGANTDLTGAMPTLTAVKAIPGVVYYKLDCIIINGDIAYEIESNNYLGDFKRSVVKARFTITPETFDKAHPKTLTTVDTFFGVQVNKKPFKWVYFGDAYAATPALSYFLLPTGLDATKCLAMEIVSAKSEAIRERGVKRLGFEFETRGTI